MVAGGFPRERGEPTGRTEPGTDPGWGPGSGPGGLDGAGDDELADLAAGGLREGEDDRGCGVLRPVEHRVGAGLVLRGPVVEEVRVHAARDEQRHPDLARG